MVDSSQSEHSLIELAERVEKAEGPDRRLDAEIAVAIDLQAYEGYGVRDAVRIGGLQCLVEMAECRQNIWSSALPLYTASLDAAMTLKAEGRVILNLAEDGISTAIVDGTQAHGGSPALALTAAALRARAATEKSHV